MQESTAAKDAAPRPSDPQDEGRTLAFRLAYDGSRFAGSQVQPEVSTVQGSLERALADLGRPVRVRLAGRTDAGVHATGQVVAFALDERDGVPVPALRNLVNGRVGPALRLTDGWEAEAGFDPRRHALSRRYLYYLDSTGAAPDPMRAHFLTFTEEDLDWSTAQDLAPLFEGEHDFSNLCLKPETQTRLVRTLDQVRVRHDRGRVEVQVVARAFLRGQVRCIVGALLRVAAGRADRAWIRDLLAGGERTPELCPSPAPPQGLYLAEVRYLPGVPGRHHFPDRSRPDPAALAGMDPGPTSMPCAWRVWDPDDPAASGAGRGS